MPIVPVQFSVTVFAATRSVGHEKLHPPFLGRLRNASCERQQAAAAYVKRYRSRQVARRRTLQELALRIGGERQDLRSLGDSRSWRDARLQQRYAGRWHSAMGFWFGCGQRDLEWRGGDRLGRLRENAGR